MQGRKPLPRGLRELKAGRLHAQSAGPVSIPDMPAWLDDDAKAEWARLMPELESRGLLTVLDMASFAMYCQCWSQIKTATVLLRKDGMIVLGSTGQNRVNPLAQHIKELYVQMRAYATEFGFTPSSRSRVDIAAGGEEEDDLEEMLHEHPAVHSVHDQRADAG